MPNPVTHLVVHHDNSFWCFRATLIPNLFFIKSLLVNPVIEVVFTTGIEANINLKIKI